MRPGLGVAHSDQPARHGYGGVRSVDTFIAFGEVSKKRFCAFKDVKDFESTHGFALARDQVFYF